MGLVAFLSDFGTRDFYVAAVKAVVKRACPTAEVIDVSHEVPPWSVLTGCYLLTCCFDDFPQGTVFLAVIDPGVGTARRPLIVKSARYWFVGPDNGLLMCVAERDPPVKAWVIDRPPALGKTSFTFHGRDIFGPVAASLACGESPENLGRECSDPHRLTIWEPVFEEGSIKSVVIHVDRFGNAALNVRSEHLERWHVRHEAQLEISVRGKSFAVPLRRTFGEAEKGAVLALVNSCGFLELAVNQGSAAEVLGLSVGDPVVIKLASSRSR